ncbi:MAG: universal stress protein [Haloferacaceae archaeon]
MYDRLLFPTDGSDGASVAFDHVLAIAARHDATVYVLNVADTTRDSVLRIRGDVVDALEREGHRIVQDVTERAAQRGVTTVTDVLQGDPSRTIVDYANARDVDLVVMPTHGRRGLERFLLGSTTERVVRRSDVPVLTLRPDHDDPARYPYRNVVVPTDGSDCADHALETGVDVAAAEGATLHLLSVIVSVSLGVDVRSDLQIEPLERRATGLIEDAREYAQTAGVTSVTGTVEYGPSVHGGITSYVDEHDVDLVVVGTHGRTGVDRYVLGSVTERLVRTSPVPVLTVREPPEDA